MSDELGRAELGLGADLAPLDRDLAKAERRVAASVAAMQKMLDSLHADVDMRVGAMEALAARAMNAGSGATVIRDQGGAQRTVTNDDEIWGIRGPRHAGSLTNPIVTVLAAGKYFPMGSYAAAVGDSNEQDAQRGDSSGGLATAAEMSALTAAVSDLANNVGAGSRLATVGAAGMGDQGSSERAAIALDSQDGQVLRSIAASLDRIDQRLGGSSNTILGVPSARSGNGNGGAFVWAGPNGHGSSTNGSTVVLAAGGGGGRGPVTVIPLPGGSGTGPSGGGGNAPTVATVTAAAAARQLGIPIQRVYQMASAGQFAGAQKQGGQWVIPAAAVGAAAGGAGGGGGGGGHVPVVLAAGGGGGAAGPGLLAGLGWGGGIAGMAAMGSLLSFAGLGFEHILTTILGILGSGTAALGGGGLLALGSLGKMGVGGGSDVAVMKSTIADTQTLYKQLQTNTQNVAQAQLTYNAAVKQYGANSQQAKAAQQALAQAQTQANAAMGAQMQMLGPAAGAELALAKQVDKLNTAWDKMTAPARIQAIAILSQAVKTGFTFLPLVAQAATTNLGIIDQGLKPLFAWVNGPQGIQIFRDLEYLFASELPTAVHAFDQGMEFFLRVVDLAAQHTGGFMSHVDHLFTRLNGLSNTQIDQEITKLVDDFRLWDHFLGLVFKDLYLLFHQDVGTGNSIIGALSTMLEKLQAYEKSARGQAEIQNIFMVHKTEILQLLHIFGELASAFAHVYMAVAPAAVTVMNDVVLPVLTKLADALAAIAHSSPLAADALGALLIGAKFGGWAGVMGALRGGTGWLLGKGATSAAGSAAASAAGSAAGTAGGLALRGLPGFLYGSAARVATGTAAVSGAVEGAGATGLADLIGIGGGGLAAGLAAAAPAIGPLLAAAAAAGGLYLLGHDVLGIGKSSPVAINPGNIQAGGKITSQIPGGPNILKGGTVPDVMSLKGKVGDIQVVGNFANYSATKLHNLIAALKELSGVKVNGVSQPKNQVLQLAEAALKAKEAWNRAFNEAWTAVNTFYRNTARTLPALYDDFNSNMKLIASTVGLNTNEGRKLVAVNVQKMVDALRAGMNSGQISVSAGMRALNQILDAGLKAGGIDWRTKWTAMFDTVASLYAHHKITTGQYLAQLQTITHAGFSHIKSDTETSYQQTFLNLKHQYDQGVITHGQYLDKLHQAQLDANSTQAQDMAAWVANLDSAMKASGSITAQGMKVIAQEVNQALGLFGASKLPIPQAIAWVNYQLTGGTGATSIQGGAGHGLGRAMGGMIDRPMLMVGEEAPTHPEYVLATNPAYRQHNLDLWISAGHDLGVPGFAGGGMINAPQVSGSGALSQVARAGLAKVTAAANSWLGIKTAGFGAGSGGPPGGPVSGTVTGWLQQAMAATGVSGPLWLAMLQRQVMRESGGNPHAINLTDSNARAGHPSKGLLQTIDSTFAAYALPGHGDIWNPVDNAIAAIRYMIATYGGGDPNRAAQVMWARGGGGYKTGGVLGRAQLARRLAQVVLGDSTALGGGGGVPDYYPLGISNHAIATAATGLSNLFQGEQTGFGNISSLASVLQGLAPGTSLSSLGLTGAGLRASGLLRRQARSLIGGGPASFQALMGIDTQEIGAYRTEIIKLKQLYRDALHNHNHKLATSLLGQIQSLDQAMAQAISDRQQALISKIQAKAATFSDKSTAIGNSLTVLQGIEGLNPGTNLAALGLSPKILKTLGLGGLGAGRLTGSSLSYFQQLMQTQGGHLTSAQLAQAKQGTDAMNKLLSAQMAPLEQELTYYQNQLPKLHGQARTDALSTMSQLAQSILQLQGSIDQNTQGVQDLTQATNANTQATNATLTGSVSYTYQGQSYLAGLSSDTTLNLPVGG